MWFAIGLICGLLIFNFFLFNKRGLTQFWKRHPVIKGIVIVLTIPISLLFLWPLDYFQYGMTIKDYIRTYKCALKQ